MDPAAVDLWFDTMRASPCSRGTARAATIDSRLIVVAEDVARVDAHVVAMGLRRRRYRALPVLEVDAGPDRAAELAALPGVISVLPPLEVIDASRTFAVGIDLLLAIARTQHAGHGPGTIGGTDGSGGYPVLTRPSGGGLQLDVDPDLVWPTAPALLPVLNLSVGPSAVDFPVVMNDLVSVATLTASQELLVVVAAGNCGASGQGSMSAWAQVPWVLAVGAVDDEEGTALADYSARGVAGEPASGPDLVALGRSALDPQVRGTSFAAPRVTQLARIVAAAFWSLRRETAVQQGAPPHGVPAVGFGVIDSFGTEIWRPSRGAEDLVALPATGPDRAGVAACVAAVRAAGGRVEVRGTPGLLRRMLLESARPVPGRRQDEVGAGFVDRGQVLDRLVRYSALDLARDFGSEPVAPDSERDLAGRRVFDPADLDALADVVARTGPGWRYDYRRRRAALPLPSEMLAGLGRDERTLGLRVPEPELE
ncbi:S8 family serine peptidase [Actinotalea sp.]|uniref:S8 family serine peptidase n=1 Tax=Actinotalea sp. TaxID=1872145 RepID=UPI0035674233